MSAYRRREKRGMEAKCSHCGRFLLDRERGKLLCRRCRVQARQRKGEAL